MTASKTKRPAAHRAAKAKSPAPIEMRVALRGDKQLTENVIIEVLAAARRLGLEAPKVQVLRKPRAGPKRIAKRKPR
jgi:biopolymer transport protein ExbD